MKLVSPFCALLVAGATLGPCHLPSALAQAQPERKYIRVGFMKVV